MSAEGTWNCTFKSQMGNQAGTLTLTQADGKLEGKLSSAMGSIDISDGSVDGDTLKWTAALTTPVAMTMDFTAKVEGDQISGTVGLGAYGTATFDGTRA